MPVLITNEDHELLDALRSDDERALTKLYDRYWMRLLSLALNRLDHEIEAEEYVQEVFVGIWRNRKSLTITHTLGAYLAVAIKNQVMNRLTKRYTKKHNPQPAAEAFAYETSDSKLLEQDLSMMVENAISQLPEKCQMVYRMSRVEGKSNKTIASELNVSEKTIEGHITKAIQTIRKRLITVTVSAASMLRTALWLRLGSSSLRVRSWVSKRLTSISSPVTQLALKANGGILKPSLLNPEVFRSLQKIRFQRQRSKTLPSIRHMLNFKMSPHRSQGIARWSGMNT
jgi:RNA polymerase sigma-70 factor (family 1)